MPPKRLGALLGILCTHAALVAFGDTLPEVIAPVIAGTVYLPLWLLQTVGLPVFGHAESGGWSGVRRVRFQLKPGNALAAVIGTEQVARPQVIKKLWNSIKTQGLQDTADKRTINADARLLAILVNPQVTIFELAGSVGRHLS